MNLALACFLYHVQYNGFLSFFLTSIEKLENIEDLQDVRKYEAEEKAGIVRKTFSLEEIKAGLDIE